MEHQRDICQAASALDIITGKWKLVILFYLSDGTKRFSELKRLIPVITPRMLTLHLRELEEQHIVKRVVYPEVPPKVEYSITEHGKSLQPVLDAMHQWGDRHLEFLRVQEAENGAHPTTADAT